MLLAKNWMSWKTTRSTDFGAWRHELFDVWQISPTNDWLILWSNTNKNLSIADPLLWDLRDLWPPIWRCSHITVFCCFKGLFSTGGVQQPGTSSGPGAWAFNKSWLVGVWKMVQSSSIVFCFFNSIWDDSSNFLDYIWPYYLQYTGVGHTSQIIPSDQEWHPAPLPPNWQEVQQSREDFRQLQDRATIILPPKGCAMCP